MPNAQHGIALLSALIVVAVTSFASARLLHQQQLAIQRSDNLFNRQQAYVYLQGVERWALEILAQDKNKGHVDHPQEIWAQKLPITPIPGGALSGRLEDMQARFNLNSLYNADASVNKSAVKQLERLLSALDLPTTWLPAILDWIDSDQQARPSYGAEDSHYLRADPALRTADQPYYSPKELFYLADMDKAAYDKLAPYICALPEYTPVNINSAPLLLLQILFSEFSQAQVERLYTDLHKKPLNDLAKLAHHPLFKGKAAPNLDGLSINSAYFRLHARAEIGQSLAQLHSLIVRKQQSIWVIQRSQAYGQ